MNIQSRLQYKSANLKRKLFSNKIKIKGTDIQGIRLLVEEDKYSNKNLTIVSHSKIEMVIDFPSKDVLLGNANRTNNPTHQIYQSIYDVLPIQGWLRMDQDYQLEQDDIVLFKYLLTPYQKDVEQEFYIQALQVASILGRFSNTLLYKTYVLSPYNFNIQEYAEIENLLTAYQLEPITI